MRRFTWLVAAAVLCLAWGCEEGDTIVEAPPPDVYVYPSTVVHTETTIREEDSTPDVTLETVYVTNWIIEEDTTPDVVYEWSGSDFPAIICEEEGLVSKKVSDLVAATVVNDADLLLVSQGGVSKKATADLIPLPLNYIAGLICAMGADTDHDVTIGVGCCRSLADDANMVLAAAITKQLDAAWAVGTNQGGIDAGAIAGSTLYAIWLIRRSDTGVVDALFSTSFTAPTMPADYDQKRLIGAVYTDGTADIYRFTQSGDEFVYVGDGVSAIPKPIEDATITSLTWETYTLTSIPPSCKARVSAYVTNITTTAPWYGIYLRTPTGSSWTATIAPWLMGNVALQKFIEGGCIGDIVVDSSKQIQGACYELDGTATLSIWTFGFTMLTRREP